MSLATGTKLGPYEIVAPLGAGGMGEVYRARDTTLNRDVALKVLPDAFILDPDRLARFKREAQVLASLNHPHIAAIHGFEESTGVQALVLELVEGPTLADRIAAGPIPLDEALPIARQITEALQAAHGRGIIHRDLKPANIKITSGGAVKVLDFGLAKAVESAPETSGISMSPTLTSPVATRVGMLLGTAAYMSPEQARGRPVDKRTDIWAFGCVLFEMLTGKRAFEGEDISLTLAEVMKSEPNWSALPQRLSPGVRAVLKRCLHKDPNERLHDMADVRLLMEGALDSGEGTGLVAPRALWQRAIPIGLTALVLALIGGLAVWTFRPVVPLPIMRSVFTLPEGQILTNAGRQVVAISPDGTQMVYVANQRIYLRSMSALEAKTIPGTEIPEGVLNPVFSPDGGSIAFWSAADQTIKRLSVSGGAPVTICQAVRPYGLSWQGDVIVFGQGSAGISRVSANGGQPEVLVTVKEGELAHGPQIMPDGQAVLFTIAKGTASDRWDKAQIVVHRLPSGERKTLIEGGSDARYVPTGHLLYALAGVLFAVPFDLGRLEVRGAAVPIVQGVRRADTPDVNSGVAHFGLSTTGSLIYVPGPESTAVGTHSLALVDRKGNVELLKLPPGSYQTPRMSPDGKRIAYSNEVGNEQAIYVHDLSGSSAPRRLTFGGRSRFPVWSADGVRVAFQSEREGALAIFWQRADGADSAEQLTKPDPGTSHTPESWSPSGDTMLFTEIKDSLFSSWTFSLRDKKVEPLRGVTGSVFPSAMFSPDGQWVLHRSTEAGTFAVHVQPFPATGAKYEIITNGGFPVWSRNGREIFFVTGGQLSVLSIVTRPSVTFGNRSVVPAPRLLFGSVLGGRPFDVTPDGRILGLVAAEPAQSGTSAAPRIHIVVNWHEELKRLVPTK